MEANAAAESFSALLTLAPEHDRTFDVYMDLITHTPSYPEVVWTNAMENANKIKPKNKAHVAEYLKAANPTAPATARNLRRVHLSFSKSATPL